jgi:hypothetical protein
MKKPREKNTRDKHERRNAEYEKLHRICAEAAVEERERERVLHDEINVLLRQASQEERPVWRHESE